MSCSLLPSYKHLYLHWGVEMGFETWVSMFQVASTWNKIIFLYISSCLLSIGFWSGRQLDLHSVTTLPTSRHLDCPLDSEIEFLTITFSHFIFIEILLIKCLPALSSKYPVLPDPNRWLVQLLLNKQKAIEMKNIFTFFKGNKNIFPWSRRGTDKRFFPWPNFSQVPLSSCSTIPHP